LGIQAPDEEVRIYICSRFFYVIRFCRLRAIDQAWVKIAAYMHQFSEERKADIKDAANLDDTPEDIFTRLVAASDGIGKYALEERELVRSFLSPFVRVSLTIDEIFVRWRTCFLCCSPVTVKPSFTSFHVNTDCSIPNRNNRRWTCGHFGLPRHLSR
jgi:hypothetical protein